MYARLVEARRGYWVPWTWVLNPELWSSAKQLTPLAIALSLEPFKLVSSEKDPGAVEENFGRAGKREDWGVLTNSCHNPGYINEGYRKG